MTFLKIILALLSLAAAAVAVIAAVFGMSLFDDTHEMAPPTAVLILMFWALPAGLVSYFCAFGAFFVHRRQVAKRNPAPADAPHTKSGRVMVYTGMVVAAIGWVICMRFILPLFGTAKPDLGLHVLLLSVIAIAPGIRIMMMGWRLQTGR